MSSKKARRERKEFEARFEPDVQEIIILTDSSESGASKVGQADLWMASQRFIAYFDCKTQKVIKEKDQVEWLVETEQEKAWRSQLVAKEIYRVSVRKSKPANPTDYEELISSEVITVVPSLEHRFALVAFHGKEKQTDLVAILREYEQPVLLNDEVCGIFELNKDLNFFEGTSEWLDQEVLFFLDVDAKGSDTANEGLATLKTMKQEQEKWDQQLRAFSAKKLTELANDWLAEEDSEAEKITEKDFVKRIELSELSIQENGNFTAYYRDGDLFWGHVILVEGNIDGKLTSAYIAG